MFGKMKIFMKIENSNVDAEDLNILWWNSYTDINKHYISVEFFGTDEKIRILFDFLVLWWPNLKIHNYFWRFRREFMDRA